MKAADYLRRYTSAVDSSIITIDTNEYGVPEGVDKLVDFFIKWRAEGRKVFFIGNGGSSAIAIHMTADFMKNGGMKTVSLYDNAVITCFSNDYGYEYVFSKQIEKLMENQDILVAISSSGNSMNIINAIESASSIEATTISFTGFSSNNKARNGSGISIYVPSNEYGIVESIHNMILQAIVDMILEKDNQ